MANDGIQNTLNILEGAFYISVCADWYTNKSDRD
jgi:hypothetical protein